MTRWVVGVLDVSMTYLHIHGLCLQHLLKSGNDVVKRWVNEAQEAVSSDNAMVQVCCICWPWYRYVVLCWLLSQSCVRVCTMLDFVFKSFNAMDFSVFSTSVRHLTCTLTISHTSHVH